MKKPLIFDFSCPAEFLSAYHQYKQQTRPYWSLRLWSRKLNFKDVSTLCKIIKGERKIGNHALQKFIDFFKFSATEKVSFEKIIGLSHIVKPSEINYQCLFSCKKHRTYLQSIASHIGRTLVLPDCVIYLKGDDGLHQMAAYGKKLCDTHSILDPIVIPIGEGVVGFTLRNKTSEIVEDTRFDRRYIPDVGGGLSEISVPILFDGKSIGVIDCEAPLTSYFDHRHRDSLIGLSQMIALYADAIL